MAHVTAAATDASTAPHWAVESAAYLASDKAEHSAEKKATRWVARWDVEPVGPTERSLECLLAAMSARLTVVLTDKHGAESTASRSVVQKERWWAVELENNVAV